LVGREPLGWAGLFATARRLSRVRYLHAIDARATCLTAV